MLRAITPTKMTFKQLYQQLMQRTGAGYGAGPQKFKELLFRLGNPHLDYPIVHVAGTNGKGSCCYLTASVLQEAGHRTGLFISPHLFSACERISINRNPISKRTFVRLSLKVFSSEQEKLNFFEILTAVAFLYFSEQKANYVVLETGLGGSKDPTNVCQPVASVITSIGLDHCALLGNTLSKIAREKAGIIKSSVPVFCPHFSAEIRQEIDQRARAKHAPVIEVKNDIFTVQKTDWKKNRFKLLKDKSEWTLGVLGEKQPENAALVYRICRYLGIGERFIRRGFTNVCIPCRFEVLSQRKKTVIIDGAHNPQAMEAMIRFYKKSPYYSQAALVCGFMADKDFPHMLQILSAHFRHLYITLPPSERAASLQSIKKLDFLKNKATYFTDDQRACEQALKQEQTVLVSGSFYLAASVRTRVGARKD